MASTTNLQLAIFDPDINWAVEPSKFLSKGKNTPLTGRTLKGKILVTILIMTSAAAPYTPRVVKTFLRFNSL